jgi:hypothetical protein
MADAAARQLQYEYKAVSLIKSSQDIYNDYVVVV